MATTQHEKIVSLERGASFQGDFCEVVRVDTNGRVVLAGGSANSTHIIVGVIAEETRTPAAGVGVSVPPVGSAVSVALVGGGGVLKMKAGAAITAGQLVVPDATAGRVAGVASKSALAANQVAIGIALDAAADGEIFRVLVQTIAA